MLFWKRLKRFMHSLLQKSNSKSPDRYFGLLHLGCLHVLSEQSASDWSLPASMVPATGAPPLSGRLPLDFQKLENLYFLTELKNPVLGTLESFLIVLKNPVWIRLFFCSVLGWLQLKNWEGWFWSSPCFSWVFPPVLLWLNPQEAVPMVLSHEFILVLLKVLNLPNLMAELGLKEVFVLLRLVKSEAPNPVIFLFLVASRWPWRAEQNLVSWFSHVFMQETEEHWFKACSCGVGVDSSPLLSDFIGVLLPWESWLVASLVAKNGAVVLVLEAMYELRGAPPSSILWKAP